MIKKIKIKNDVSSTGKNRTIYALKGEVLNVTNERGDMLIVKGKKEIFPIHKSEVIIIE
jgi:hypothetical protein